MCADPHPFVRLLLRPQIGEDVPLASWTLVESGMYTSAACLIGLRPVLHVSSKWLRVRMSTIESRLSALRRKPETAIKHGSQESVVNIFPGGTEPGIRMQAYYQDLEHGRELSKEDKNIRIWSDIRTMSTERNS